MKVFCLRIGNKYGPEYERYIEKKLEGYDLTWVTEPFDKRVALQWNKMFFMGLDIDEPICVIDIDLIFLNDYKRLFDYPIRRGQFLTIRAWWESYQDFKINGGFFKYYPKDCKFMLDKFISNIEYWQRIYITKGLTIGPVNGEQFFVEQHAVEELDILTFDDRWVTNWSNTPDWNNQVHTKYKQYYNETLISDDKFNDNIKLIHFTTSRNKPHECELFSHLYT